MHFDGLFETVPDSEGLDLKEVKRRIRACGRAMGDPKVKQCEDIVLKA